MLMMHMLTMYPLQTYHLLSNISNNDNKNNNDDE